MITNNGISNEAAKNAIAILAVGTIIIFCIFEALATFAKYGWVAL